MNEWIMNDDVDNEWELLGAMHWDWELLNETYGGGRWSVLIRIKSQLENKERLDITNHELGKEAAAEADASAFL